MRWREAKHVVAQEFPIFGRLDDATVDAQPTRYKRLSRFLLQFLRARCSSEFGNGVLRIWAWGEAGRRSETAGRAWRIWM